MCPKVREKLLRQRHPNPVVTSKAETDLCPKELSAHWQKMQPAIPGLVENIHC